jgi:hypothetical protein
MKQNGSGSFEVLKGLKITVFRKVILHSFVGEIIYWMPRGQYKNVSPKGRASPRTHGPNKRIGPRPIQCLDIFDDYNFRTMIFIHFDAIIYLQF